MPACTIARASGRPAFQLRRTTSAELLVRDEAADEEDDEDFSSDDESFRFRPPSVASTATSQRSSRRGVRVQDWTERPSGSFVRDVRITGYHAVGSESGGFVVFDIEIDTLPVNATSQSTTIRIHRRYSAFARLRSDLLYAHPRFRNIVPRLPPKSSLGASRPFLVDSTRSPDISLLSQVPPVVPRATETATRLLPRDHPPSPDSRRRPYRAPVGAGITYRPLVLL
uniref:BY PROTMAP: gi/472583479/gb/EMS21112.1/ Phox-like domain-containing protein [Rhodosporidium toruloides NP11] gi/647396840/emb/CDR39447.1/ RHTO0S04e05226g1_1 [Rhodosporidium toruloides] n=1 Tax=Rhodotorula toruloides TaxID=5286 RepID=A0A0K3C469_RHOTO